MQAGEFLTVLLHTPTCSGRCCYKAACVLAKAITNHIHGHHDLHARTRCDTPCCLVVRKLLTHWQRCTRREDCSICALAQAQAKRDAAAYRIICMLS